MESLIVVKQLPVIEERLRTLKESWEQRAADAEAMVCTEETIQAVKAFRADMRKEFEKVEAERKAVKKAIMDPYESFEAVYRDCVSEPFRKADRDCAFKICDVEDDMKRRCEDGLRDYFAELRTVYHLDWLEYERAGIRVDMASAKAKTPSKLRKRLSDFVVGVDDHVKVISEMEDAEEIMVEYRRTLDAAGAIFTVQERRRQIEEQRAAQEARKTVLEQEAEAVRRVEALAPPVATTAPQTTAPKKNPDDIFERFTYTVLNVKRSQLWEIRDFLKERGIQYE